MTDWNALPDDAFRREVHAFYDAEYPKHLRFLPRRLRWSECRDWYLTLSRKGWIAPAWPRERGGMGLSPGKQVIMLEEQERLGLGRMPDQGITQVGPTIMRFGTEAQKERYLPPILAGENIWCQGYSEPNAGSDLSNLGLRAVLDGDQWVLNGQKIWTSSGHLADHIFTLARTDADAPKHKGISFLLVDMRQPGIEVRPIEMISGEKEFNEVFYTDVRVPKENVVGGVNNGWAVAMGLLGYERGEAAATAPIRFAAELDRLLTLAKERGVTGDARMRQRLANAHIKVQVMRFLGMRTLTRFLAGHHPGPESAIFKVFWSEYHRKITELGVEVLGMDALVPSGRRSSSAFQTDDVGAPNSSNSWVMTFLHARAGTIYAGSSEIQRNILGEMVLGLPKEPKPA